MKAVRTLGRIVLPASLVLLAACQSMPGKQSTETQSEQAAADTSIQANSQGAPVAVFLADTVNQQGWTPVQIQSGTLYVNPQPIVTRDDLVGVQAGTNKEGAGLLALGLNNVGQSKITNITTQNPNKRLALVVGRTMLAAPSYTTPVKTEQLVFAVGTDAKANASAAARAIAGVDANGNPLSPAEQGASQEGAAPQGAPAAPASQAPAGN